MLRGNCPFSSVFANAGNSHYRQRDFVFDLNLSDFEGLDSYMSSAFVIALLCYFICHVIGTQLDHHASRLLLAVNRRVLDSPGDAYVYQHSLWMTLFGLPITGLALVLAWLFLIIAADDGRPTRYFVAGIAKGRADAWLPRREAHRVMSQIDRWLVFYRRSER